MIEQVLKYKDAITRISKDTKIPFTVIATIALNESGCNPEPKPYFEKTWRYFTNATGKPLNLRGSVQSVQEQAKKILGEEEFDFQVHAHGAFQTVGSVLRELGYRESKMTNEFYAQGYFAMTHLSKMRNRFVQKFKQEPTNEQLFAMYNGGFGAVDENGIEPYVVDYVAKAKKNYSQVV